MGHPLPVPHGPVAQRHSNIDYRLRSSDSNSYTTVRAYQSTAAGDGYIANSPDDVCYLVVRRPGDTEDATEPKQIIFPRKSEEPEPAPIGCRPRRAGRHIQRHERLQLDRQHQLVQRYHNWTVGSERSIVRIQRVFGL